MDTGWFHAGVGTIILAGIYGASSIVLSMVHSADNNNDESTKKEVARIEACGDIDDDALRTICINGEDG